MLQSLRNRRNRKGFTLAELLIVVAIIAVLVAIAVPLFVSGLQKAQKARDDANVRSLRAAAVVAILDAAKPTGAPTKAGDIDATGHIYTSVAVTGTDSSFTWELVGPWYVSATLSADGQFSNIKIQAGETGKTAVWASAATSECAVSATGGGYTVYAQVTAIDLTKINAT